MKYSDIQRILTSYDTERKSARGFFSFNLENTAIRRLKSFIAQPHVDENNETSDTLNAPEFVELMDIIIKNYNLTKPDSTERRVFDQLQRAIIAEHHPEKADEARRNACQPFLDEFKLNDDKYSDEDFKDLETILECLYNVNLLTSENIKTMGFTTLQNKATAISNLHKAGLLTKRNFDDCYKLDSNNMDITEKLLGLEEYIGLFAENNILTQNNLDRLQAINKNKRKYVDLDNYYFMSAMRYISHSRLLTMNVVENLITERDIDSKIFNLLSSTNLLNKVNLDFCSRI